MSYNKYALAHFLVDFEPGGRVGVAKVDFTTHKCSAGSYLPVEVKKGDICEFTEYGIEKISSPGCFISTKLSDDDNATLQAYYNLLRKRFKVSDAKHMARSEGRATSRPGSSSESSTKPSKEKWEEHMFGSFCTPSVQLDDREKAYGTKAVPPAYF